MYADDCSIFLKDTEDMENLRKNIRFLLSRIWIKNNRDKTQIMKLGSSSHSNENLTGITLGKMVSLVKVLGIYFSLDINVKEEMNYKEILSKIKRC